MAASVTSSTADSTGANVDAVGVTAAPLAPPAGIPLTPSQSQPSTGTLEGAPTSAGAANSNASPGNLPPASSVADSSGEPNDKVAPVVVVPPPQPDEPVLLGDTNRFAYAFFTYNEKYGMGDSGDVPFLGVVFTDDANFCSRPGAPLRVSELTVYQLWSSSEISVDSNVVYNRITYPDIFDQHLPWTPENLPSGFSELGWRGTCALLGPNPPTSIAFRRAAWKVTPPAGETLATAQSIAVNLHASNDVQEIAWSLTAQRCDLADDYFQSYAGHHVFGALLGCERTLPDPLPTASKRANKSLRAKQSR